MIEDHWFQDRGVDEPPNTVKLGWLIWFALGVAMLLTPLLYGCSSAFNGICGVKPIGQDENGIAYFAYHCEPS